MARIDVDVDIDDILWSMSSWEKQEMADALYDDGVTPKQLNNELGIISDRTASTSSEQELYDLLDKVWMNKLCLGSADIEILQRLAKKGLHD